MKQLKGSVQKRYKSISKIIEKMQRVRYVQTAMRALATNIACSNHLDKNAWITRMKGQWCMKVAQGKFKGIG